LQCHRVGAIFDFVISSSSSSLEGILKVFGQTPPPAAPQDFSLSLPAESALVQSEFPIINPAVLLWTRSPVPDPVVGDIDAYYFTASINNNDAGFHTIERSYGLSIRCISIHDSIPPSD
jgi:hypothetical protein